MSLAISPKLNEMSCIGKCVIIELIRRKYLFVMGALVAVFCIGAIGVRVAGVDNPVIGAFVLNLGLTLAYGLSHVMTVLLSARQIPDELQNKTIYPRVVLPHNSFHQGCQGSQLHHYKLFPQQCKNDHDT